MNGPVSARAFFVQRSSDEFFAGSGLASDAHARFAGGHVFHLAHYLRMAVLAQMIWWRPRRRFSSRFSVSQDA